MSGAFWQNPTFKKRYTNPVSVEIETQSPTPEATALYAANSAAAAARAEAVLALILEQAELIKAFSEYFVVSDGRLCIDRSRLSTDPTQDGELYDNGALIGINYED